MLKKIDFDTNNIVLKVVYKNKIQNVYYMSDDEDDVMKDDFALKDDSLDDDLFDPLDDDSLLDDDLTHSLKDDEDEEDFVDSVERYG